MNLSPNTVVPKRRQLPKRTFRHPVGACVAAITVLAACSVERGPLAGDGWDASYAGSSGSGGAATGGSSGLGGSGGLGGVGGIGGIGGIGGSGGVGGVGGSGGVGAVGGSGGVGGVGGVGGSGGVGGTGGVGGGIVDPFACVSTVDKRTGSACAANVDGWFAIKSILDVWWQGIPTRDPGRGLIDIYLLAKVQNVCSDGSNARVTIKACGTTLPTFTSDVACDAFQIEFPTEMWDRPSMPRFTTTANTSGFNPGDILSLTRATGLIGIDLRDGSEEGAWPTSMMTNRVQCEAGTGIACFPDHDDDNLPGVTIRLRTDEAIYTGPYTTGNCSSGVQYKYRGAPTVVNIAAGGGAGGGVRAARVQIGIRTRLAGSGAIDADCRSGVGASMADFLDSRALACEVSPSSLSTGGVFGTVDPRLAAMNYACTSQEAQFVDDNVPIYRVLQAGQMPGDSGRPMGWQFISRDIPKHASVGPRSALVRLADLAAPEPTCATVRDTRYPAQ